MAVAAIRISSSALWWWCNSYLDSLTLSMYTEWRHFVYVNDAISFYYTHSCYL